jgi:hypothetical protein
VLQDGVPPGAAVGQQADRRVVVEPVAHLLDRGRHHRVAHVREDQLVPCHLEPLQGGPGVLVPGLDQPGGHDQGPVQPAVLEQGRDQEVARGPVRRRRHGLEVQLHELLEALQRRVHEGLAVREVVEQTPLGHSGGGGDGVEGRGALAVVEDDLLEGGQELVPGHGWAGHVRKTSLGRTWCPLCQLVHNCTV